MNGVWVSWRRRRTLRDIIGTKDCSIILPFGTDDFFFSLEAYVQVNAASVVSTFIHSVYEYIVSHYYLSFQSAKSTETQLKPSGKPDILFRLSV
jgi:hypothetical protein